MALSPDHESMLRAAIAAAGGSEALPVKDGGGLRVHAIGSQVWVRFTGDDPQLRKDVEDFLGMHGGRVKIQGNLITLDRSPGTR